MEPRRRDDTNHYQCSSVVEVPLIRTLFPDIVATVGNACRKRNTKWNQYVILYRNIYYLNATYCNNSYRISWENHWSSLLKRFLDIQASPKIMRGELKITISIELQIIHHQPQLIPKNFCWWGTRVLTNSKNRYKIVLFFRENGNAAPRLRSGFTLWHSYMPTT